MASYYKSIKGIKYDRQLLEAANHLTKGRGDGRISKKDARILWNFAHDGRRFTNVEKRTLAYILENSNMTRQAAEYLRENLGEAFAPEPIDVDQIIEEVIRSAFQLQGLTVQIDQQEAQAQSELEENNVTLREAVAAAINSFLIDYSDVESPGAIVINVYELFPGEVENAIEQTIAKLKEYLNSGTFRLLPNLEWDDDADYDFNPPEYGESAADNWVFSLSLPDLSDHIYWAIVARDGSRPTYNYGFN